MHTAGDQLPTVRAYTGLTLVVLAIALICGILLLWLLCRVSSWVVFHDHVWQEMRAEGRLFDWYICEGFNVLHQLAVLPVTIILSAVLLIVLVRRRCALRPQA